MADDSELILGATQSAPEGVEDVTTADFRAKVMDESAKRPVLVDFWAPWCGPCKQLAPVLEKVVRAAKGKVKLVKMNIDDHPQIAGQLNIKSIPAVIAFQRGQPVDGFMGAVPETQIKGFIERLIGPLDADLAELLAVAETALEAGDFDEAIGRFQSVIEQDDTNGEAFAGVARALIRSGDVESASEFLESLEDSLLKSPAIVAAKAELNAVQQASEIGDLAVLVDAIARNPEDHQSRFDLALGLNAAGKRDEAADHLLHIIRTDRAWNDEAARKQLLEFFSAWGATHPGTKEARRKLSALLFS